MRISDSTPTLKCMEVMGWLGPAPHPCSFISLGTAGPTLPVSCPLPIVWWTASKSSNRSQTSEQTASCGGDETGSCKGIWFCNKWPVGLLCSLSLLRKLTLHTIYPMEMFACEASYVIPLGWQSADMVQLAVAQNKSWIDFDHTFNRKDILHMWNWTDRNDQVGGWDSR